MSFQPFNPISTRSTHITPNRFKKGRTCKSLAKPCGQCGHVWTAEELANGGIQAHMVKEHGFKQYGAQVYQSVPCLLCPKPGLYKVGSEAYCKDHLQTAIDKRKRVIATILDPRQTAREQDQTDRDKRLKKVDSLNGCKRGERPGKGRFS